MGSKRGKARGTHTKREPSGRPSRAAAEDYTSPTAAKRLRDAAIAGVAGAEWGTEIGRLYLAHKLTHSEFSAANKWNELRVEYYAVIGAPLPWPPPGPLATLGTPSGRGDGNDPSLDTKEGRRIKDYRLRIENEYARARIALGQSIDMLSAFRLTVEQEQAPIGAVGLGNLRYCLSRLARHWGIFR